MNKPQKWSEKENSREKMCFFFFVLYWCSPVISPCCQGEGTLIVNGGNSVFQLKQQIFISFIYFRLLFCTIFIYLGMVIRLPLPES